MSSWLIILLLSVVLLLVAILISFAVRARLSRKYASEYDGGLLRPCGSKPNCVCSENQNSVNAIEPLLLFEDNFVETWTALKEVVREQGGVVLVEKEGYVAYTFMSAVLQFVDDVEFRLDQRNLVIHVRSGSRIGYSDLGVNRKRVNKIREAFIHKCNGL